MSDHIDREIADLEQRLADLRRQKLADLESQMSVLRSLLGEGEASSSGGTRTAGVKSPGKVTRKKTGGGRKRWQRFSDGEAIAALREAVARAGKEGIPGKQASIQSGVSYPRALTLMDANFRKRGSGKWTRYSLK